MRLTSHSLLRGLIVTGTTLTGCIENAPQPTCRPPLRLATGAHNACFLTNEGGVACWGSGGYGLNGDGSWWDRETPVDALNLESNVTSVHISSNTGCAVKDDGSVYCWGDYPPLDGLWDRRGGRSYLSSQTPVKLEGIEDAVNVYVSGEEACAVTERGGLTCWDWWRGVPEVREKFESGVASVVVRAQGASGCVVTTQNSVRCWGARLASSVGVDTDAPTYDPTAYDVPGFDSDIASIDVWEEMLCGVTTDGALKCVGKGYFGDGEEARLQETPFEVTELGAPVNQVVLGISHACALTVSGGVKCWGWNNLGQLGNGTGEDSLYPDDVSGLSSGVRQLSTSTYKVCALHDERGIVCWGEEGGFTFEPDGNTIPIDASPL